MTGGSFRGGKEDGREGRKRREVKETAWKEWEGEGVGRERDGRVKGEGEQKGTEGERRGREGERRERGGGRDVAMQAGVPWCLEFDWEFLTQFSFERQPGAEGAEIWKVLVC